MARSTPPAVAQLIACSPDRPPNRTITRGRRPFADVCPGVGAGVWSWPEGWEVASIAPDPTWRRGLVRAVHRIRARIRGTTHHCRTRAAPGNVRRVTSERMDDLSPATLVVAAGRPERSPGA